MIIDGKDLLLGRVASYAAKKTLLGQDVNIINCEQMVVSGVDTTTINEYKRKYRMGIPSKGPFIHRNPEKFVKRVIRGMLPHKTQRGKKAFAKVKCYRGIPEAFKDKKAETLKLCNHSKLPNLRFTYVNEICKELGAR